MATSIRLGILASGTGTNFDAIADAIADGRPQAAVAGKAERRGIRVAQLNHADYESREGFDSAVADILQQSAVELVVMAGFDRLVTPALLSRFPRRVINIHPALLPAFKGLDAQGQAAEYGVKLAGATVHIVDEKVDHGPIVIQSAVPVFADDDAESVRLRIRAREHEIYPYAIQLFAENRVLIEGRSVSIDGDRGDASTHLTVPPIDWKRD